MAGDKELNIDLRNWNESDNDKSKIEGPGDGLWVPCRICQEVFLRIRLTGRYCNTCGRAFCEGEHGSFASRGPGVCVQCHRPARR
jgi:hypothetical protein